ncbi:putative adenylyl-sulfate kinase [bacterium BMS3Abin15]|nr:putative adenylyl-sulfate kinase [bacterium BMS3Abin15]HDZ85506.1 adenylyl-sulfate kinase [Candidatus Moranbacteria bacterium]
MNLEGKQKGFVLWLTGLSGSGKSTIADKVHERLVGDYKVERLDGDIVREHITRGLGFSKEDRDENIKRIAYIAEVLSRHGVGVIASFISPYKEERKKVQDKVTNYIEVHVNTPLNICEKRDVKGMYAKARKGEIPNFTGVSDPYEEPENPHISVCGDYEENLEKIVNEVIDYLRETKHIM